MQPFDTYLALGDSMSIDKYAGGPGLGACALLYRNDDAVWPAFKNRDLRTLNPTMQFRLLAEDGHTSADLERDVEKLRAPRKGRTLVTITIGGNDLLGWGLAGVEAATRGLTDLSLRLDRIVGRLRALVPDAVTLLGNVYDPTDGTGRLQSGGDIRDGLAALIRVNDVLAETAQRCGLHLVDIHGHFLGHGIAHADPASPYYRADDPSGWIVFDIEPNPRGSSEIRRLFWNALQGTAP